MGQELGNIHAIGDWAIGSNEAEHALQLGSNFFLWENFPTEGRRLIRAALALPSAARYPRARLNALFSEGTLARFQGDYAASRAAFEQCRELDEQLGGTPRHSAIRWSIAWADVAERTYGAALRGFEEVLAAEKEMPPDTPSAPAWRRYGVAVATYLLGDYARARSLLDETLAMFLAFGDPRYIATALTKLGYVAREAGDSAEAREYFARALADAQALGYTRRALSALAGLAGVIQLEGDAFRAAQLFGAAAALQQQSHTQLEPDELHVNERRVKATQAELGESAFVQAWSEGQALNLEEAIAHALNQTGPLEVTARA